LKPHGDFNNVSYSGKANWTKLNVASVRTNCLMLLTSIKPSFILKSQLSAHHQMP